MNSRKKYKNTGNTGKNINNIDNDLTMILKKADNVTLDDIEFDKLFKEQKHILCDIRNILIKTNDIKDYNQVSCDDKTNLDDFRNTYNQLKNKYSLTGELSKKNNNLSILSRVLDRLNINKKTKNISGNFKKKRTKKRTKKTQNKNKISLLNLKSSNKLNTRYPVVLVNKSTSPKNLFYVNMDKKKIIKNNKK